MDATIAPSIFNATNDDAQEQSDQRFQAPGERPIARAATPWRPLLLDPRWLCNAIAGGGFNASLTRHFIGQGTGAVDLAQGLDDGGGVHGDGAIEAAVVPVGAAQ